MNTEARYVRGTHPHCFRSGQWAEIVTTLNMDGRDCWMVRFPDRFVDFWPIDDELAGYEFTAEVPA